MLEMKAHTTPAQFKVDFEARQIEGYASRFGNVDGVGDVVEPGAFRKTCAERLPKNLIKYMVDHTTLIGRPVKAEEDGTGLFTVGLVSRIPEGDKVLQLVIDQCLTHMSFMYDVVRRDWIESSDPNVLPIRRLIELKLYEFGPVAFPANEQAEILSAKDVAEMLREADAARPQLAKLMAKPGFLADPEIVLVQHLNAAIRRAFAESVKALSELEPEPATPAASVAVAVATTLPGEPPPQTTGAPDPEEGIHLGDVSQQLAALDAACAAVLVGAPVI